MLRHVQRDLESMLPELDALLDRQLFSREELKHILDKRVKFEHRVRSSTRTVRDFYKYIEFEQKFEDLRKLRSAKQKKKGGKRVRKSDLSEFCIVRHIHAVFARATFSFKTDIDLWKQWFAFCRESRSTQRLSKVQSCLTVSSRVPSLLQALSDALRLNAQDALAEACPRELDDRQNVNMARTLMQRALRSCKMSEDLWVTYFKLELCIAQKLCDRQAILLDASRGPEAMDGLERMLDGSMALCVYREAVRRLPSSFEFRRRFLDAVDEMSSFPHRDALTFKIFETIEEDFEHLGEAWDMRARRAFSRESSHGLLVQVEAALAIYAKGLRSPAAPEILESAVLFLADVWNSSCAEAEHLDAGEVTNAAGPVVSSVIFEQMCSIMARALSDGGMPEKAFDCFGRIAAKQEKLSGSHCALLDRCLEEVPTSLPICGAWIHHICTRRSRDPGAVAGAGRDLLRIVKSGRATAGMWERVLQACCEMHLSVEPFLDVHFGRLAGVLSEAEKKEANQTTCHILQMLREKGLREVALEWAQRCLSLSNVDATAYLRLIDFYTSEMRLQDSTIDSRTVSRLLEKAVRAYGNSEAGLWVQLMRFEHQHGRAEIGEIYQRALHSGLKDLRPLEHAMRTLT